jgi:hypothetical protein
VTHETAPAPGLDVGLGPSGVDGARQSHDVQLQPITSGWLPLFNFVHRPKDIFPSTAWHGTTPVQGKFYFRDLFLCGVKAVFRETNTPLRTSGLF